MSSLTLVPIPQGGIRVAAPLVSTQDSDPIISALPATLNTLGVVQPDGTTITINAAGVISASGGGGGVTAVTGVAPIASSGGTTPAISVGTATTAALGVVKPDGTSITISAGVISAAGASGFINPGGRLTLTSGQPVPASDVTGAATIYYTAMENGFISLYNGSGWTQLAFANNTSLSLAGIVSGHIYDVFGKLVAGALVLELSTAWTNNTTRSSALALVNGVTVQASDNALLLGTIYATGSGTTSDAGGGTTTQVGGARCLWNAFNKVLRAAAVFDSTANWAYTTATIRQANGNAGNQITFVSGETSEMISAQIQAAAYINVQSSGAAAVGVGIDSTTAFSGLQTQGFVSGTATVVPLSATYQGIPGIGFHTISWNEIGGASTTMDFFGLDNGAQSGMSVQLFQ